MTFFKGKVGGSRGSNSGTKIAGSSYFGELENCATISKFFNSDIQDTDGLCSHYCEAFIEYILENGVMPASCKEIKDRLTMDRPFMPIIPTEKQRDEGYMIIELQHRTEDGTSLEGQSKKSGRIEGKNGDLVKKRGYSGAVGVERQPVGEQSRGQSVVINAKQAAYEGLGYSILIRGGLMDQMELETETRQHEVLAAFSALRTEDDPRLLPTELAPVSSSNEISAATSKNS